MAYRENTWRTVYNEGKRLEVLRTQVYARSMDTRQTTERARRVRILVFWRSHGLAATKDAFGVSRATLFRWQRSPIPQSRRHHAQYQKRIISLPIASEIIRLRREHPRLGKVKLAPLLARFCRAQGLPICAEPTVGRMLSQLKTQGSVAMDQKLRLDARTGQLHVKTQARTPKPRRKGYRPTRPGDLLQLDTIVTFVLGLKRYTHTAIDCTGRFGFAFSYRRASSASAADFLAKLRAVTPFPIKAVQTDNGSEFLDHFDRLATTAAITHFFTYPKHPQSNGTVERFNRTLQEEFLDHHRETLADDLPGFNRKLIEYLLWYNGERVHQGLKNQTPLAYLGIHGESHLGWART